MKVCVRYLVEKTIEIDDTYVEEIYKQADENTTNPADNWDYSAHAWDMAIKNLNPAMVEGFQKFDNVTLCSIWDEHDQLMFEC